MASCTIFTAVWGKAYVERFLSLNVRTLLASGNLPAFRDKIDTQYLIVTTQRDREVLQKSKLFRALADLVPVKFIDLPQTAGTQVERKNNAWALATNIVRERRDYAMQMPPDVALSDGSLNYFADLILAGKKAVFVNWHVRARLESFTPAFEQKYRDNPCISISSRELVHLTMQHSHPLNAAYLRNSTSFPDWPEMIFWPVKGQGLLMHVLALTPFIFDSATCELNQARQLVGDHPPDQLAFATDSDDVFMVSLAELGKDRHFYARFEKLEIAHVAWWWSMFYTPTSQQLAAAPFRIKFGDWDEMAWQRQERRARKFMRQLSYTREMYQLFEAAKKAGCERAGAIVAYALSIGLAQALQRRPAPVAIFVPTDEALERMWSATLNSLLIGPKSKLLMLIRRHIVNLEAVGDLISAAARSDPVPTGRRIASLDGQSRDVVYFASPGIGSARIERGPIHVGPHQMYLVDRVLDDAS